jgi:hypothetical protein
MTTAGRDDPVVAGLLRAAAVAGERFSLTVMAKVLDLDPRDCLAAVDRAVRAGVLVAPTRRRRGLVRG